MPNPRIHQKLRKALKDTFVKTQEYTLQKRFQSVLTLQSKYLPKCVPQSSVQLPNCIKVINIDVLLQILSEQQLSLTDIQRQVSKDSRNMVKRQSSHLKSWISTGRFEGTHSTTCQCSSYLLNVHSTCATSNITQYLNIFLFLQLTTT